MSELPCVVLFRIFSAMFLPLSELVLQLGKLSQK